MAKVLVVVAHADDEALGCGATIAKHAANGDDITLLVMTDGVSARNSVDNLVNNGLVKQRESALQKSCKVLGVTTVLQCNFPDNRMDSVDLLSIVQKIEKETKGQVINIIYTHALNDLNVDHQLTAQAVLTAFRPLPDSKVQTILSFEVLSSTEWQFSQQPFIANWFVDVSDFYQKKVAALTCYQEEMRDCPHPRSYIAVESQARLRGSTIGKEYAEAFQLLRHSH
ncbi:MAG: LmbE family N-acetylglucosaminyl deacetylase [Cognaticolwellia sp.]|jgi:LmbE family N-acetylglucosaminyl deacetylase